MTARTDTFSVLPALLRRWSLIALLGMLGLLGGALAAYVVAPVYRAEANLLFRFGREYFPVSPGEMHRNWGENVQVTLDTALNTELRLMQSRSVMEAVHKSLPRLPEDKVPSDTAERLKSLFLLNWKPPPVSQPTAGDIAGLISIRRAASSLMVTVSARHTDPQFAEQLVAGTVKAYLDRRESLFADAGPGFFDRQIEDAQTRLKQVDAEIAPIRDSMGRRDVAKRLSKLELAPASAGDGAPVDLAGGEMELKALEMKRSAIASGLEQLHLARERAAIDAAFWESVNPRVEIVDEPKAGDKPIGIPAGLRLALGGFIGLAVGALLALLLGWWQVARRLPERQPD